VKNIRKRPGSAESDSARKAAVMRSPSAKAIKIIGALTGEAIAIVCCLRLVTWMEASAKQTGHDAGNAGAPGCIALFLFPAAGWFIGAFVARRVYRNP
jgi:hypothetical protein